MSTDEMAQVFKYLSAVSREVGEFRQEFIRFRDKADPRLDRVEGRLGTIEERLATIEREQRQTRRFTDRVQGLLMMWRSEAEELRDRVETLEEKG